MAGEEPQAGYDNRITITTSEALEEQTREHTRYMTHLQRMEYLQKLINITHGYDLSKQEKQFLTGKHQLD